MAGLQFALAAGKDFIGKSALADQDVPASRLISLIFDDADMVPLGNEPVFAGERIIGKTTSAAFGYRVGRPVAIAQITSDAIEDGAEATVNIGGTIAACRMSAAPVFDPAGGRMRPGRS